MSDDRNGDPERNGGANARPLHETIAGTGPGIADDSLAPGQEAPPEAPSDEEVARAAKALAAPVPEAEE